VRLARRGDQDLEPGDPDYEEAWVIRSSRAGTVSRRVLITVAVALIPLIAGCEAGSDAPSLHWHQPTAGTGTTVGDITISNVFVLGAPIGSVLPAGQNAALFLGLTNSGDTTERLVAIRAPGVASSVLLPSGGVTVHTSRSVLLTGPKPAVIMQHLTRPLAGGTVVTIDLDFARLGVVRMRVPVMPRADYYATLLPAPAPSPTGTATPGRKDKHHHGGSSPSPTASTTP
jgi:copper(I)-binding protein